MADSKIGGSEGSEKGQIFIEDSTDFSLDELLRSNSTDQETTDPEQNIQREFDPAADTNGFLQSLTTKQGTQAGSGAQLWLQQPTINQGRPVVSGTQPSPQRRLGQLTGTNESFPWLSTNQGGQAGSGAQLWPQQQFRQPLGTNEILPGFLPTLTMNEDSPVVCGTPPWPQQQLGQPADSNGCLLEPWMNQVQGNQAAAAAQSLIAQQHSGQSPIQFTGVPHSQRNSVPHSVLRKRGYDKIYRAKQKKYKQDLEYENERLGSENERLERENERLKHESEKQMKSLEAEHVRLKRERHEVEEQMKLNVDAFEAENGRLKRKKHEYKVQMKSFEAENGILKREKHELEEQMKSLEAENGGLKPEVQVQEQQMKSSLVTKFKQLVRDGADSLKRDNARELVQLPNKVDKLGLQRQNQRIKEKGSTSSTKELWAQFQEKDSVDSAKKFPSEMQRLTNNGVEAYSVQWKKKIVIKVQMKCGKCRAKALKIAAGTDGVNSLAIQGADKDEMVVTGEGIDLATLTCTLTESVGFATIVSLQEEKADATIPSISYHPPTPQEVVVCDPNPSPCSIL